MWQMGFSVGKLLLANFARTAAECPIVFYVGLLDQVSPTVSLFLSLSLCNPPAPHSPASAPSPSLHGYVCTHTDMPSHETCQVRLWDHARTSAAILNTALLDTVPIAPPPPGLLGYWTFDDPIDSGLCAQSLVGVADSVSGATAPLLHGASIIQVAQSDLPPIEHEPVRSSQCLRADRQMHALTRA